MEPNAVKSRSSWTSGINKLTNQIVESMDTRSRTRTRVLKSAILGDFCTIFIYEYA